MNNLEHQSLSSVRRSEGSVDIAGHIRKEDLLRQQLDSERASKRELVEKLTAEKDEIRLKTKQVVELFKSKLAATESNLQNQAQLHGVLEKRQAIATELLTEHISKWKCWNSYLQQSNGVDMFAEYLIGQPMRFISSAPESSEITIANFSDIPEFMISELDTIINLSKSAGFASSREDIAYVTVRPSFESINVCTDLKQVGKGKELGSPGRRRPLQPLDMNSTQPAMMRSSSGDMVKAVMSPARARGGAVPPLTAARRSSSADTSTGFTIFGDHDKTQPDRKEDITSSAIVVELQTKLAATESAMAAAESVTAALQDRYEALNTVLVSERTARSALEATAAEVPNLQLTVQKLEGKVVKLKSSLDKSRAEAQNLRETLQRERDTQFNLQLRHTTEREAFAASAAAAAAAQEEELDRLRSIVAAPNAPLLALEAQLLRAQAESTQAKSALAENAEALQALRSAIEENEKMLQDREAQLRSEHTLTVQALEEQLRSLREQVESATTSVTESDVAGAVLRGQLEMQKLCLTEAQNSNSAVQVRLAQSEREVEQLQEDLRSKTEAVDALLELLRSTEEAFAAERTKLKEAFEERQAMLSAEGDELRMQLEASTTSLSSLQSELAIVREEAVSAQGVHLQKLQELRAELETQARDMEAARMASQEEHDRLTEALLSEQKSSAEKESTLQAEIAGLLSQQEADRLQLDEVTVSSSDLTRQLQALESSLAAAQTDLHARSQREGELSASLASRQQEVTELTARLAEHTEVIADLEFKLQELDSTCAELRGLLQQCEAERVAAVQCSERLAVENQKLQVRINEAELQIARAEEEMKNTKSELEQIHQQLTTEQSAHAEALTALGAALRDLEESQSQSETLAAHLRDALAQQANLESTVQAMTQQVSALESDAVRLQAAFAAKVQECEENESRSSQALHDRDQELQQVRADWEDKLEFWSEKWIDTDRQLQEQMSLVADSAASLLRTQEDLASASEESAVLAARVTELEGQVERKDQEIILAQQSAGEGFEALRELTEALSTETLSLQEKLAEVEFLRAELVDSESAQEDLEALVRYLGLRADALRSERDALHCAHDGEMFEMLHWLCVMRYQSERRLEMSSSALQQMTARCTAVSVELTTVRRVMTEKGDALLSVVEASRDRIAVLESEKEAAGDRLAALESELGLSTASVAALQLELEASRDRSASLESELESFGVSNAALQSELEVSRTSVATLESKLESSGGNIAAVQSELEGSRAQVASLESELEGSRAATAALESTLEGIRTYVAVLKSELDLSRTNVTALQSEREASLHRIAALATELDQQCAAAAEADLVHRSAADAFARQCQEKEEKIQRSTTEASTLRLSVQELNVEIEGLRAEHSEVILAVRKEADQQSAALAESHASVMDELSSQHDLRVAELAAEIDQLSATVRDMTAELATVTSAASALRDERESLLRSASQSSAEHVASLRTAEALASSLQTKVLVAEGALESAQQEHAAELDRLNAEISVSTAEIASARECASALERSLSALAAESAQLQTAVQGVRAQHMELLATHEVVTQILVALEQEYALVTKELHEQSAAAQLQRDVLNEAIGDLTAELTLLKQEASNTQASLTAELNEMNAQLSTLGKDIEVATAQLGEKTSHISALEGSLAATQAELEGQIAHGAALDEAITGLRAQHLQAQEALGLAQAELSAAEAERDDLASMIARQDTQLKESTMRSDQLAAELASAMESSGAHVQHLSEQLAHRSAEAALLQSQAASLEAQLEAKSVELAHLLAARVEVEAELSRATQLNQGLQDQLASAVANASAAGVKHAEEVLALSEALATKEEECRLLQGAAEGQDRAFQCLQQSQLERVTALEATIAQLREEIARLQQREEELEATCNRTAEEITSLHRSQDEKTSQISALEDVRNELQTALSCARDAAAMQEASTKTAIAELQSRLTSREAELQSALQAATDQLQVLTERSAESSQEAQRLRMQLTSQETSIAQGEQRSQELEELLQAQRICGDDLQSALTQKTAEAADLASQLERLTKEKAVQATVIASLRVRSEEDQVSLASVNELSAAQAAKLSTLERECKDSEVRAQALREKLGSVQRKLDALQEVHAQLVQQSAEVAQQRDVLQQKVGDHEQALSDAEASISALEDELEALSSARCAESAEYLAQLKEKEFALTKLQEQHAASAQSAATRLAELEAELRMISEARDADSVTYIAELDCRNAMITTLEEALQSHLQQIAELSVEIAQEKTEKSDLAAQIAALTEELAVALRTAAATEAELAGVRSDLVAEQERAHRAAALLEQHQAEASSAADALQETLRSKEAELSAALESLQALQTTSCVALSAAQADAVALTEQLAALRHEYQDACGQIHAQECALEILRQELAQHVRELSEEKQDRLSDSACFTAEKSTLLQELSRAQRLLEEQVALGATLRTEIDARTEAVLQAEQAFKDERSIHEQAVADVQAAHHAHKEQVAELTVRCETLQTDLDAARAEVESYCEVTAELRASVEQLKSASDADISALAQQLSDSQSNLAVAQAAAASVEQTLGEKTAELAASQQVQVELKAELSLAQEEIIAKNIEHAAVTVEMGQQLDSLHAAKAALVESLRSAEGRAAELAEMLATSEAASTAAHARISLLEQVIGDLTSKQEQLLTENEAEHLNLATKIEAREARLGPLEQEISLQQARIAELQSAAERNAAEAADAVAAQTSAMQELEGQLATQMEKTEKLVQDIAERESIIAQLCSASEDLKSALATQAEQHAQLTQELSEREITAAGLRERVGELEEELAALLEQKSQLTQDVFTLEAAAKQSHAALEELAQQLAAQDELNGTLAQQVSDDQCTIEKLRTELAENTAELSASGASLEAKSSEMAALADCLNQLRVEHAILSAQLVQRDEELEAARSARARQQALLSDLQTERQQLQVDAESSSQAYALTVAELQTELDAMRDAERLLVEEIFVHEKTITEMKEALAQSEEEHLQLLKAHEDVSARAESTAMSVSSGEQRVAELTNAVASLESDLTSARSMSAAAAEELAAQAAHLHEMEQQLQARCSALEDELSASQREVTALTASTVHAQLLFTEATADIASLQVKYDDVCLVAYKHHQSEDKLTAEIARVQKECAELKADIIEREAALVETRAMVEQLEQRVVRQQAEHDIALTDLLQQVNAKAEEVDASCAAADALKSEVDRLSTELAELTASAAQKECVIASMRGELQTKEALLGDAQSAQVQALEALVAERAEYEARIAALEQSLDESEFVSKELNDAVESLRKQLQESFEDSGAIAMQLEETSTRLAEQEEVAKLLRGELEEIEGVSDNLRKDLEQAEEQSAATIEELKTLQAEENERMLREFSAREAHVSAELQEKCALVDAMEKSRRALSRELEEARQRLRELQDEMDAHLQAQRELEYTAQESASRAEQLDHALASMREVAEVQSTHYHAERDAHLREVQHLKDSLREREHVAQELNVRLLSVMEGSDDNRRRAHEMDVAYRKVYEAKLAATAELEALQEEHAVLIAQDHLRTREIADLRERLHQSEAVLGEVRQQLASRSAWSAELSTTFQQSQETVMKLATELAAKEAQLVRANTSLTAVAAEVRNFEEVNLKLDIQAQGLTKALQEVRGKLIEQERIHSEVKKSLEARLEAALGKAEENEFVILELNARLEEESSLVFELDARLMERPGGAVSPSAGASPPRPAAAPSASEEVEVLNARIQLLDEHISDLEVQLQARSGEYDLLLSEARDKDEAISSLQRQLDALHECQTPEATRTEYSRREAELRDALAQHYELHVKSLQEKLSTAEALLATTQLELQQYHDSHPEPHIDESPDSSVISLDPEEVRSLQQSLIRLRTKVASKSKQILLLNQQMLRDRQNFQKLKRSLVKLDSLKSTVFANNCNPVVAPPLPVHQVSELYHLGMEEGEKKVRQQHEAQLAVQEEEVKAIQARLQSTLSAMVTSDASPANAGRSEAAVLNARVTALQGELDHKLAAQLALLRQVEEMRVRRSEAEAAHYLALNKSKMECAALRKTVEDLQSRTTSASHDSSAVADGVATEDGVKAWLDAALVELQVQRRLQEEQEAKFGKAVRTLKAMEARSQALGEQCVAANKEIAMLTQQIATLRS